MAGSRRGWRREEPGVLPAERPTWLHRTVLRALAEGVLTLDEAKEMAGEELPGRLPSSLVQRE